MFELPTESEPVRVIEGDCLDVLRSMPDGCVDAVVADPPYFGVRSERLDNQWETAAHFIAWLGSAADEWRRVLKANGSLYCFASPRMVARVESMLGERFTVLNSITWQKDFPCGALKYGPENFRGFVEMSERIVFAEQSNTVGRLISQGRTGAGLSRRDLDVAIRGKGTGLCYRWEEGSCLPTAAQWELLSEMFPLPPYADAVRPFFATIDAPYSDVWTYKPVAQAQLTHPCEKPLPLMRHILRVSTRPGDVILDPFAGSGSTGVAAVAEDRRCVLVERDATHAETCRRRVAEALGMGVGSLLAAVPTLFDAAGG
jgi:site-specific DNA-methyltransferase (adenine-specific)